MTPPGLAFVGDAVYTLYVRKRVVESVDCSGGTVHVAATKYVNAKAQAEVFDALAERGALTDEEAEIARRAKNAHLHSRAKGATPSDYHKATALEAVIGYLYLDGRYDRVNELLDECANCSGLADPSK